MKTLASINTEAKRPANYTGGRPQKRVLWSAFGNTVSEGHGIVSEIKRGGDYEWPESSRTGGGGQVEKNRRHAPESGSNTCTGPGVPGA